MIHAATIRVQGFMLRPTTNKIPCDLGAKKNPASNPFPDKPDAFSSENPTATQTPTTFRSSLIQNLFQHFQNHSHLLATTARNPAPSPTTFRGFYLTKITSSTRWSRITFSICRTTSSSNLVSSQLQREIQLRLRWHSQVSKLVENAL